jgi:hypothetical protein
VATRSRKSEVVVRKTLLGLAAVAVMAGCKTPAAPAANYQWSVKAPSQVTLGSKSKLRFVVETRTPDGQVAAEVPYRWVVEWVGLHGSEHQGYSSREEEITVKGGPGKASLRILASQGEDRKVEVAHAQFDVIQETLPAK